MKLSKDELMVAATAIDMLIRAEGNMIAQSGAIGIRGKADLLSERFKLALAIDAKIQDELEVLAKAEEVVAGGGGGG